MIDYKHFPRIVGRNNRKRRRLVMLAIVSLFILSLTHTMSAKEEKPVIETKKEELRITEDVVNRLQAEAQRRAEKMLANAGRE